jgi:hypothetical protein
MNSLYTAFAHNRIVWTLVIVVMMVCLLPPAAGSTLWPQTPDSSWLAQGSSYGSFVDLFRTLPVAWAPDRGATGQPAVGALFASRPGDAWLRFESVDLDNPLTGSVDLNDIPTEAIGHVRLALPDSQPRLTTDPLARGLALTVRDMASVPIHTAMGYRTGGRGFDDVIARLGIQASPDLKINAGAMIKSEAGNTEHENYSEDKFDLVAERLLGHHTNLKYTLLHHRRDVDLILPQTPAALDLNLHPLVPDLLWPHLKQVRTDHALSVHQGSQWRGRLQWTRLQHEIHDFRYAHLDDRHDVDRLRWESAWRPLRSALSLTLGSRLHWTKLSESAWGEHEEWQGRFWVQGGLSLTPASGLTIRAGLYTPDQGDAVIEPELSFYTDLFKGWQSRIWLHRIHRRPTLEHRFSTGPLVLGNRDLGSEQMTAVGIALSGTAGSIDCFASVAAEEVTDPVVAVWDPETEYPEYRNGDRRRQLAAHLYLTLHWWQHLSLRLQAGHLERLRPESAPIVGRPAHEGRLWLQYRNVWFQGDLDARLRLVLEAFGPQTAMFPVGVLQQGDRYRLDSALVPSVEATLVIRDATLFVALRNPLALSVEPVPGYPMPKSLVRWGLVWTFVD